MIFSHPKLWVRVAGAIPAVLLVCMIFMIYFTYMLETVHRLLTTRTSIDGVVYAASPGNAFLLVLSAIALNIFFIPHILSYWRTVRTDAGAVPAEYIERHLGLVLAFRERQVREAGARASNSLLLHHAGFTSYADESRSGADRQRSEEGEDVAAPTAVAVEIGASNTEGHGGDPRSVDAAAADATAVEMRRFRAQGRSRGASRPHRQAPPTPYRDTLIPSHTIPEELLLRPGPHDPRFCFKCQSLKAPRTHHCSMCGRCVTMMDHHCPWTANCIGFGNYKFFYLLLFHGFVSTLVCSVAWAPIAFGWWEVLQPVGDAWPSAGPGGQEPISRSFALHEANVPFTIYRSPMHYTFSFVLCCSLTFSLAGFLGVHTWLVLTGRTTLEAGGYGASPYSHGWRHNWRVVFGSDPRLWFWPVQTDDVLAATCAGTDWRRYIGDETPWPRSVYPLSAVERGRLQQLADVFAGGRGAGSMTASRAPAGVDITQAGSRHGGEAGTESTSATLVPEEDSGDNPVGEGAAADAAYEEEAESGHVPGVYPFAGRGSITGAVVGRAATALAAIGKPATAAFRMRVAQASVPHAAVMVPDTTDVEGQVNVNTHETEETEQGDGQQLLPMQQRTGIVEGVPGRAGATKRAHAVLTLL